MERLVTLFGGGGFLGRYVAQELLKAGVRVRIAERDPSDAWFLKPLGGLGQTQFVSADITRADSAKRAAAGSTAVVNLVGILKGNFQAVHVTGARNAAEAAAATGADAFVQISAIGADPRSESAYARTKGEGEAAVRDAFPGATILRPSILFGPEDQFINRFARLARISPVLPVIRGKARFQPVWVSDVARAIAAAALDPDSHAGKTYELGGPQILTMAELNAWVAEQIGVERTILPVPDGAASLMARLGGWLPGAPMSWDQWLMLQRDNVVAPDAEGFDAFGIAPTPLAAVAPGWLVQYRRHGRFARNHPST
ncbi:complex I NDUFA9 subunit family protein [Sphingomonas oleivorans]|uniref:Complex I NDUFA9 subunit family protein n=1 Tax=Sphingomonas oleivorans TaxID=1735121 RepID=A0A2T5G310_9SPHN|nr:complex I NDUFA9 subunit family protein [Sphingomonas oleivorans]PTQ13526.1 complex I NDUFA9 subunit family protein [Sphingomonas oleivorans]